MKRYEKLMKPAIKAGLNTKLYGLSFYCRYLSGESAYSLTCRENNRHIDYSWKVAAEVCDDLAFETEAAARARIIVRKINGSDQAKFGRKNIFADPSQPITSKGTDRTPTSYIAEDRGGGMCRGLSKEDGERWEAIINKDLLRGVWHLSTGDDESEALEAADKRQADEAQKQARLTREAQETERRRAIEVAAAEAFAAEEARVGFYDSAETFGQF